jgi:hypothetical protein
VLAVVPVARGAVFAAGAIKNALAAAHRPVTGVALGSCFHRDLNRPLFHAPASYIAIVRQPDH